MSKNNIYDSLDLTKWIGAFLIIVIHASPFAADTMAQFYIVNVLARTVVPVLFSISGFLFFRKINFDKGKITRTTENITHLWRYVKHLSIIYIGASVFYLLYKTPMWYAEGWWGMHALKDYLASFFLSGSEYHLWYILASIYGIILLYIMLSFIRIDVMKYLCAAGWIIECLLYSYSWIGIKDISVLNWLTSHFPVCFDAAFRAVPLLAVGIFCAQKYTSRTSRQWMIFSIILFIGWIAEASFLYFFTSNEGRYSYILITPLFVYCILNGLLAIDFRIKNRGIPKWMRDTSLIIYIVHPMVIYLLDLAYQPNGWIKYLAVTLISIIVATAHVKLEKLGFASAKHNTIYQ